VSSPWRSRAVRAACDQSSRPAASRPLSTRARLDRLDPVARRLPDPWKRDAPVRKPISAPVRDVSERGLVSRRSPGRLGPAGDTTHNHGVPQIGQTVRVTGRTDWIANEPAVQGDPGVLGANPVGRPWPAGFAHRGGALEEDPNSWGAIALTDKLRFWLETDISVDSAGVPVLLHPTGLARLLTFRRLRSVGAAPRLSEVLGTYPSLRVMIDVKLWPAVEPTARAIAEADAADRIIVGTFSQQRTRATAASIARLTGRQVPTALSVRELVRLATGDTHDLPHFQGRVAQIPYRLATPRLIERAHRAGAAMVVWTVNDPARMQALLDAGVDGVITDFPTKLAPLLAEQAVRRG
jgi:glycerophosphoryl diester phosphodiesterase